MSVKVVLLHTQLNYARACNERKQDAILTHASVAFGNIILLLCMCLPLLTETIFFYFSLLCLKTTYVMAKDLILVCSSVSLTVVLFPNPTAGAHVIAIGINNKPWSVLTDRPTVSLHQQRCRERGWSQVVAAITTADPATTGDDLSCGEGNSVAPVLLGPESVGVALTTAGGDAPSPPPAVLGYSVYYYKNHFSKWGVWIYINYITQSFMYNN